MSLGRIEINGEGKVTVDLESTKIISIDFSSNGSLTIQVEDNREFQMKLIIPPKSIGCEFCSMPGLKKCTFEFDGENLCKGKVHCIKCSLDEGPPGSSCFLNLE